MLAESSDPEREPLGKALIIVGAFTFAALAWQFTAQCGVGLAVAISGGDDALSPGVIGTGTAGGLLGMAALAFGAARALRRPVAAEFALRRSPLLLWVVAALGGLVAGLFPGWIVGFLSEHLPVWAQLGALDTISEALERGGPLGRTVMFLAVCVVAPICEELVFRGFLWRTLERALPPVAVWVFTSMLFGAYHIDPVQGIPVILTGLFLGWLRLTSRSVGPSILAHAANNTLAAIVLFSGVEAREGSLTFAQALLPLAITIALGGVAWRLRAPSPSAASGD